MRDVSDSPFDRRFPRAIAESLSPELLALEASDEGAHGTIRLELKPAADVPSIDRGMLCWLLQVAVFRDEACLNVAERQVVLLPGVCATEPGRAQAELEALLHSLPRLMQAAASALARGELEDGDAVWQVFDAVEAVGMGWRPRAPECREWMAYDHCVAHWSDPRDDVSSIGLLTYATTPELALVGADAHDAYREDDLGVTRLVTGFGSRSALRAIVEAPDAVITTRAVVPWSDRTHVLVLWADDPRDEYGELAMAQYQAREVPLGADWYRHEVEPPRLTSEVDAELSRMIVTRALALRGVASTVETSPTVRWLMDGLRDGRWTDPSRRPPLLAQVEGRLAMALVLRHARSEAAPSREALQEALAALVRLGAAVEPESSWALYTDSGEKIPGPLDAAAQVSEELAAYLRSLGARPG